MRFFSLAVFNLLIAVASSIFSADTPDAAPVALPGDAIVAEPGVRVYAETEPRKIDNKTDNLFSIYIPPTYKQSTPMPLLVTGTGNGPKGIDEWKKYADEVGFIVLSPTCVCYRGGEMDVFDANVKSDEKMILSIMPQVFKALSIDQKNVLFTGCSAGAFPTWFVAARHPEIFTALCFRSANFVGEIENLNDYMPQWKQRPIYLYWGENDRPHVYKQNEVALQYLETKIKTEKLTHEIVPKGGHSSRPDLASKWFASIIHGEAH